MTLAEGVSGSREAFVEDMNDRAAELGLEHTSYANPIGLDEPGNHSSARDLATLTRVLLRRPRFARIVDMPEAELESGSAPARGGEPQRPRGRLSLGERREDRLHADAGNVLVGAANGPGGVRVISVVLGEPTEAARDQDTLALLRWGLARFHRVRVLDPPADARPGRHQVPRQHRPARAARAAVLTIRDGEHIRRRVNAPDEVEGPLEAGARVGTVTVLVDGRPARRVALVTAEEVPGAGTLRVLLSGLGVPLTLILAVAILVAAVLAMLKLSVRIRIVR